MFKVQATEHRIFTHLATQQPARNAGLKSTHPSPTLTTWSYVSWLTVLAPSHILLKDTQISTTKHCLVPFYIKHLCQYHRYLESEEAKLWAWHFGSYILVMFRLVIRNINFRNQAPGAGIIKFITAVIYGFRYKLECFFLNNRLGWKGLPGTNTLAYCGNRKLRL
jgi:hypothetical protein